MDGNIFLFAQVLQGAVEKFIQKLASPYQEVSEQSVSEVGLSVGFHS
jgi:hypothetical protein